MARIGLNPKVSESLDLKVPGNGNVCAIRRDAVGLADHDLQARNDVLHSTDLPQGRRCGPVSSMRTCYLCPARGPGAVAAQVVSRGWSCSL